MTDSNMGQGAENSFQEVHLRDYLRVLFQYKFIAIIVFLLVVVGVFIYTIHCPKIYSASSRIMLENNDQDIMFQWTTGSKDSKMNNQMELLKSTDVINKAIASIQSNPAYTGFPIASDKDPAEYVLRHMKVDSKRDNDVLNIVFNSENPQEAMELANAIAQALSDQNTFYARTELTAVRVFLEEQLELKTRILRNSEDDLRSYKLEAGVSDLTEETKALIEKSADLGAELKDAETEQQIAVERLKYLQGELSKQDSLLVNVNTLLTSPLIDQLRSDLVDSQSRLARLLAMPNYNQSHPEIEALSKEIENSKAELYAETTRMLRVRSGSSDPLKYRSDLIENIASAMVDRNVAESKVQGLTTAVEEYNQKLRMLPDTEIELARLERAFEMNEKIHDDLVDKYETAKISEQSKMGSIRLVQAAAVPIDPVKPNKTQSMLFGLLLGLFAGVGVAFLIHSMDAKLRTLDDMDLYVRAPLIGTIPYIHVSDSEIDELEQMIQKAEGEEKSQLQVTQYSMIARLITSYAPKSPVSEAYRSLRTNLIAKRPQEGPISILITSSGPKEGKSTTNANLAIALAKMDTKVILVDLDLRRPMLHTLFNLKKEHGCSDYLSDFNTKLDDFIKRTYIPNLDIMTSGLVPPNPSELISTHRLDNMITELKQHYDFILFDSPPVVAVTDALIISKKVDMMALVVRVGVTDRQIIKRTREILFNVGTHIAGAIVNGIEVQKYYSGYGYYYYYYYYYYYDNRDGKHGKRARSKKGSRQNKQLPGSSA